MNGSTFLTFLMDVLHAVSQSLLAPDILLLLAFIGYALFCIGSIIAECFSERRHFKVAMPKFLAALMAAEEDEIPDVIKRSGLLRRQKAALLTVYDYRVLPGDALVALIKRLVNEEESRYDRISGRNAMAARVSPMLGLMGTLIPLGPGIQALGKADTAALSTSLLVAFDTTVAGLVVAAVCLVIGKIRNNWYANYMSALDSAMATMLQKIEDMREEGKIKIQEPSDYAFLYEGQGAQAQGKAGGLFASKKASRGAHEAAGNSAAELGAEAKGGAAAAGFAASSLPTLDAPSPSAPSLASIPSPFDLADAAESVSKPELSTRDLPSIDVPGDDAPAASTFRVAPPIEEVAMPSFLDTLAEAVAEEATAAVSGNEVTGPIDSDANEGVVLEGVTVADFAARNAALEDAAPEDSPADEADSDVVEADDESVASDNADSDATAIDDVDTAAIDDAGSDAGESDNADSDAVEEELVEEEPVTGWRQGTARFSAVKPADALSAVPEVKPIADLSAVPAVEPAADLSAVPEVKPTADLNSIPSIDAPTTWENKAW